MLEFREINHHPLFRGLITSHIFFVVFGTRRNILLRESYFIYSHVHSVYYRKAERLSNLWKVNR